MPDESAAGSPPAAQRLCSEIQLFDLCDLDSCRFKQSRFCTNDELLAKFEAIKEDDEQNTLLYDEEEEDDSDAEADLDECDDSFEGDDEF
jgi:hypothetical protein